MAYNSDLYQNAQENIQGHTYLICVTKIVTEHFLIPIIYIELYNMNRADEEMAQWYCS